MRRRPSITTERRLDEGHLATQRARRVRKGDVLFEGVRDGEIYSGTAYIFTRRCGKVGYDVLGTVRNNETQIVMRGNAPRFNASCKKVGSRPDKLVFSLN